MPNLTVKRFVQELVVYFGGIMGEPNDTLEKLGWQFQEALCFCHTFEEYVSWKPVPTEDWKIYNSSGFCKHKDFLPNPDVQPEVYFNSIAELGRMNTRAMPVEHLQRAALYSRYLDQNIFEVSRMVSGLFINIDPSTHDYIALTDLDMSDSASAYAEGELEFIQAIFDDDGDILSGFLGSTELPPLPTDKAGQLVLDRLPDNSDHETWKLIIHKTIFMLKPKWLPYIALDTFQVNDGRWRLLYVFFA